MDVGIKIRSDGALQAGAELGKLAGSINAIGAAAASYFAPAAIGAAIAGVARETFRWAANLGDLSKKFDLSTDTLQAWAYAAELTGANLGDMLTAYKKLSQAIGRAEGGNKDTLEMFRGLGVTDLSNTEAVFNRLAQRIGQGGLSMKQLLDLTVLMGRNVNALFPAFEEGFAELQAEFKRLGLTVQSDVIDKIKVADDKMTNLWTKMRSESAPVVGEGTDLVSRGWLTAKLLGRSALAWLNGGPGGFAGSMYNSVGDISDQVLEQGGFTPKRVKLPSEENAQLFSGLQGVPGGLSAITARSPSQVDSLARMGLFGGSKDPTQTLHDDFRRLDQSLSKLIRHADRINTRSTNFATSGRDLGPNIWETTDWAGIPGGFETSTF